MDVIKVPIDLVSSTFGTAPWGAVKYRMESMCICHSAHRCFRPVLNNPKIDHRGGGEHSNLLPMVYKGNQFISIKLILSSRLNDTSRAAQFVVRMISYIMAHGQLSVTLCAF